MGTELHRQIVGIPMGTNCAPLFCRFVLFFYERNHIIYLSDDTQAYIIEAFNSTTRYLDDLFNIDIPCFERMVFQINLTKLQLNKANFTDAEAQFLNSCLSIQKFFCFIQNL